ncbi:DMT family transporter [Aquibacillus koreensis]|uniref:DMT family transporter n=1 Tax=Aquibacillus koreensis TaxID=279446 RepID=A0A9X3WM46_9BACI|nr:DMT family transporter [Aquibacillus koreensis]MCT2535447.1 DMT family transporter [Aquibacillus koreensis]MDC3422282.1 DMT family transporter [Aquibacillus koreensis]
MTNLHKGHLFNTLSIILLAISPLLSKFGLLKIPPSQAALINVLTIIIGCYVLGIITRKGVEFYFDINIILLAVFNSLGVIFLFESINMLSPVEIGFIGRFYTVFAVILSMVILNEKLSRREILFILFALVGVFLFVEPGGDFAEKWLGSLFALLYTFFFALTNILIKKTLSDDKSANSIMFTNNCISLLFIIGYTLITGSLFHSNYSFDGISYLVGSTLLGGFLGTLLLYEALKYLRFSIANVTRAFSPILLAIISFPFFPIDLTIKNTTGAILLILSILLLTIADKKQT